MNTCLIFIPSAWFLLLLPFLCLLIDLMEESSCISHTQHLVTYRCYHEQLLKDCIHIAGGTSVLEPHKPFAWSWANVRQVFPL